MSTSCNSSSISSKRRVICNCGIPAAMKTSWTSQNPGRRFLACKFYNAEMGMRGCNYFKWVDEDMTTWQREVIVGLMDENKNLKKALKQENQGIETTNLESKIIELGVELEAIKNERKKSKIMLGLALLVIFIILICK